MARLPGKKTSNITTKLLSELSPAAREGTSLVQRGLVRITEDNFYQDVLTGKKYSTYEQARKGTIKYGSDVDVNIFKGTVDRGVLFSEDNMDFGYISEMVSNINEYINSTNPEAEKYVLENPLLSQLRGKNLEIARFGFSKNDQNTINSMARMIHPYDFKEAAATAEFLQKGEINAPGVLNVGKEGTALLRFRYLDEKGVYQWLSGEESNMLLTATGSDFFGLDKLNKILETDEAGVGGLLQKIPKRTRNITGDRKLTIKGEDIDYILEQIGRNVDKNFKSVAPKTLEDAVLRYSPVKEALINAADMQTSYTNAMLATAKSSLENKAILRERTAIKTITNYTPAGQQQVFKDALEAFGLNQEEHFTQFNSIIQQTIKANLENPKELTVKSFLKTIDSYLENSDGSNESKHMYESFKSVINELEKSYDGSGMQNDLAYKFHSEKLRGLINQAKNQLKTTASEKEKLLLTGNIKEWESQINLMVSNKTDFLSGAAPKVRSLQGQTMRFLLGPQYKGVTDVVSNSANKGAEAIGELGYFAAMPDTLYKSEVSFGRVNAPGSESLGPNAGKAMTYNISVRDTPDIVYSDIQGSIFHRDEYLPDQYGRGLASQVQQNVKNFQKEIEDLKLHGKISSNIRRTIESEASINLDDWEQMGFVNREAASFFKAQAEELQRILATGVKVNEIPDLANQVLRYAMKTVVREKGSYSKYAGINQITGNVIEDKVPIYQAFMPYSTRSQIDTEGRATAGTQAILGSEGVSSRKKITAKYGDNTYDLNLFKYRFDDHKMIIPDVAAMDTVGIFKAGGGFDLDDKFINNLHFIEDTQGSRHLASFAWRQPTGPQEFALLSPHLDDKTIERMFGSDTVVGERFRRLSAGISELLDVPNAIDGLEEREINTFRYINSLAHGQKRAANMYKPDNITQEELTNAIFRIFDIGGEEKFKLGDRAKAVSTKEFAKNFLGIEDVSAEGIYLNDITKLNERIAQVASRGGGVGPLTMSIEDIKVAIKNDAALASNYRESQLSQILASKVTLPTDSIYMGDIEDIYNRAQAAGHPNVSSSYADFTESVRTALGRELTPMEYAYRAQKRLTSGVGLENQFGLEAKNAFNMYYTRMQTRSITAENGLGKYINRLGWLASGEDQRIAGAKSILEYAEKEGANEDLVKIANELVNSTFLVWNPENAIDAGIGLGEVGLGVTYQDMLRSFASTRSELPKEVAEQALNTALFAMHNPDEQGYRQFVSKHVNAEGYAGRFQNLRGLTDKALEKEIFISDIKLPLFQELLAANPEGLMDFINVSAENIGGTNIGEVAGSIAKIRSYQLGLGLASEGDVSLVGLDRTASLYKLSTIRKMGTISDYDTALASIIDEYTMAIMKMQDLRDAGKITLNETGYNQLLQELEELKKINLEEESSLLGREKLINLLGMSEKAQAKYGVINLEKQLQAAQDTAQAFRSEMRLKQFNMYKGHEASLATTELSEAIGRIRSDIERSLGDTTLTQLREKSSLLREIQSQSLNGSFQFDTWMGRTLEKYGYADSEQIAITRNTKKWGELQSKITDVINMEMSEAQATVAQAVQRGLQEAADAEKASPVSVMKKMLFEIEQMKIAERVAEPNEIQKTTAFLGKQLELILKNETALSINIGGEAVTIQQLAAVTMNQMVVDQTNNLEQGTQDIIKFINNVNKAKNPGAVTLDTNVMDSDFLNNLLKFDTDAASNFETGKIVRSPNLLEEDALLVDQILANMTLDKSVIKDEKFLLDFITLNSLKGDRRVQAEDSIRKRFQTSIGETYTATEAVEEAEKRIDLINQIRNRYNAQFELNSEQTLGPIRSVLETVEPKKGPVKIESINEVFDRFLQQYRSVFEESMPYDTELEAAARASFADLNKVNKGKYTRVGDAITALFKKGKPLAERGSLGELADGIVRNKSTIIGAAAIATGLAVVGHIRSKERTKESVSGPPLLPGGNPYERMPQSPLQNPNIEMAQNAQGTGYDVSINGDEDQTNEFMARAGMLTNGQVTGTMRNSLPQLGRNHYDAIAGSF